MQYISNIGNIKVTFKISISNKHVIINLSVILNDELITHNYSKTLKSNNSPYYDNMNILGDIINIKTIDGVCPEMEQIKKFVPIDIAVVEKKLYKIFTNKKYNATLELLTYNIKNLYNNKKYFMVFYLKRKFKYYKNFVTFDEYIYIISNKFIFRISPDLSEITELAIKKIFKKINRNNENIIINYKHEIVEIKFKGSEISYKIKDICLSEDMKSITLQLDRDNIIINIKKFK